MARKALVEKNKKTAELIKRYAELRQKLTAVVKDPNASWEDKVAAHEKIASLPKRSSVIRYRNRCALTGRPRGYMGKFLLCRHEFRRLALQGVLPGVKKASW